jgi:hypothetical protein
MSAKAQIETRNKIGSKEPKDNIGGMTKFTTQPHQQSQQSHCAWPGCQAAGTHRAPKDRSLKSYVMYCLDHVRSFNASWDFHIHMTPKDIEAEIRRMATWDRPTWPVGAKGNSAARNGGPFAVNDPFDLARGTTIDPARRKKSQQSAWAEDMGFRPDERRALRVLDINQPMTLIELKRHYKAMVKRYHPDTNGGSAESESRMKAINAAYTLVSAALRRIGREIVS